MPGYNCPHCKGYDDMNCYCCRRCGHSVQVSHQARIKLSQTYVTNEKYCDCCGKAKHGGACSPKIQLIR